MKPPIYQPPYDSPIEDAFARNAVKHFDESLDLSAQVEIKTICGFFRVDFLVKALDGRITVIECDGKEFHDEYRDDWRDAMILGSGDINEIYRIRGSDINYRIEDVFYLLSLWSPWLFNDRQKNVLTRIVPEPVTRFRIDPEDTIASFSYTLEDSCELQQIIEKRHKLIPKGKRQFWQAAFKYASELGGGDLDKIMSRHSEQWNTW